MQRVLSLDSFFADTNLSVRNLLYVLNKAVNKHTSDVDEHLTGTNRTTFVFGETRMPNPLLT